MTKFRKLFAKVASAFFLGKAARKKARHIFQCGRLQDFFAKRERYDCIFSLGEACFIAQSLKRAGLRRFSGPLDWVSDAPFERRIALLKGGFTDFFRKEDLVTHGEKASYAADSIEPHAIYYNTFTQLRHPHDFPFHGDFEKDYVDIAAKYERRCKRLIHMLHHSKRVLMLYGESDRAADHLEKAEVAARLADLQSVFPAALDLLYLKRKDGLGIQRIDTEAIAVPGGGTLHFAYYRGLDATEALPGARQLNDDLRRYIRLWLLTHAELNAGGH